MRPKDDRRDLLAEVEDAAARGVGRALAHAPPGGKARVEDASARSGQAPGWPAVAVAVAILGSIVWFGIDFNGRLGQIEGKLSVLTEAVKDWRALPQPEPSPRGTIP